MRFPNPIRTATISIFLSLGAASTSFAQGVPAELPPTAFGDNQFTDSSGCIFVRVSVGTATQWVPRVGMDRMQMCGFMPTFADEATQTAADAAPSAPPLGTGLSGEDTVLIVVPDDMPEDIVDDMPEAGTVAVVSPDDMTLTPVILTTPQGAAVTPQVAAAPQMVRMTRPARTRRAAPAAPAAPMQMAQADTGSSALRVPSGYRAAWGDGRLNPMRGVTTPRGDAQMAQVWTNTVPRRLVSGSIRPPVVPGLNDQFLRPHAGGRAVRSDRGFAGDVQVLQTEVPEGHRVALAGAFETQRQARRAVRRLSRAGVEAQMGRLVETGALVVMAGPYAETQDVAMVLGLIQQAGYPQAITR